MTKIFGLLVTKNEAGRYLEHVLDWHNSFLDGIFVYDDQSDDDTVPIATLAGAKVEVRPDEVPSFAEHEGAFRQAAWNAFELRCHPGPEDWVLCFDADEFLVATEETERDALERMIDLAELTRTAAVDLRIDEVFEVVGGVFRIRVDGYWAQIHAPRLVRFQPGGKIPNRKLASGSVPAYAHHPAPYNARSSRASILHLGYLDPADRAEKYQRYIGVPGHNPRHVASILERPALTAVRVERSPL